ncbi:unnamed protein product [Calypogeia fissa]
MKSVSSDLAYWTLYGGEGGRLCTVARPRSASGLGAGFGDGRVRRPASETLSRRQCQWWTWLYGTWWDGSSRRSPASKVIKASRRRPAVPGDLAGKTRGEKGLLFAATYSVYSLHLRPGAYCRR